MTNEQLKKTRKRPLEFCQFAPCLWWGESSWLWSDSSWTYLSTICRKQIQPFNCSI